VIRYQWCPTFVRFLLLLFLALTLTIPIIEHAADPLSLRAAVEHVWAAMALRLVFTVAINRTEIRTSHENVLVLCMPVGILPRRTFPRSEIVSVHHWVLLRKGVRYRLGYSSLIRLNSAHLQPGRKRERRRKRLRSAWM